MFFSFFRHTLIFAITLWPFDKADDQAAQKKTQLELPEKTQDIQWVRILLMKNVPSVILETASPYQVFDSEGRPIFKGSKIVPTTVKVNGTGIQFGSQIFRQTPITIQSDGEGIRVGGRVYRHALTIVRNSSRTISVVNEIDVEDYLKGVLPWEANPQWPIESLKAQAVASRTYALFKAIEHKQEQFVMSQDMFSQVYKGKGIENSKVNQAIEATRGEVLTYKDKIFPAYFHSTCGGKTTAAHYLWRVEKHPALQGVTCNFCSQSRHYRWQARFSTSEIQSALRKQGYTISGIRAIEAADIDESGRARYFVIHHKMGKTKIHSNDFRIWLDPVRFKSTLIQSISHSGKGFVFKGKGWGHGGGMCQYGMKGLAELGYSYRNILEYYYPGAEVTKIKK